MSEKVCADCEHFRQHYTFDNRKIFQVHCGHCVKMRVRHRKPDAKGCADYAPAAALKSSFVSKEYLSKELLQYVLRLELLPEIEDAP